MWWTIPLLLISGGEPRMPAPHPSVADAVVVGRSTTKTKQLPVPRMVQESSPPKEIVSQRPDVDLICFGATWCEPCQRMKDGLGKLRSKGWDVYYNDVETTQNTRWTRYHRQTSTAVPHLVMWVDDEPWEQAVGEKPTAWIEDWLNRAANAWRVDHGVEPVPFKAYGETTASDPLDREYFYREHWRMTPGTCGMLGCTVHGGGWVKERTKVFKDEVERDEESVVGSTCPTCAKGRGFF